MSDNITYYSKHAVRLTAQYNSVSFEQVHEDWLDEIPQQGFALDIGAGSGRDARYLASRGLSVVAVEPAGGIRERAQHYAVNQPVHWLDDSLPELKKVFNLSARFDLILLSAVWMHIVPSERERCLRKVSGLLKANGKIVISLRHGGAVDDGRTMYPVSADELSALAKRFGLSFRLLSKKAKPDELGRSDVTWETVVLTLPDDGSGAFPLLRNIIVNDSKSSTYKVALLRTLLRIAEGHPGAVIDRTDGYVVLPAGLVALYWIRLFKPLLDHFNLPQNSDPAKKPGFLKEDGWEKLASFSGNDLYVGANFSDPLSARAVHRTIKDVATVIRDMPARYITLPGTKDSVFHVTLNHPRVKDYLSLDGAYFASVGKFYVPERIWDSLSRFSVWIEPSLVNEWVALMESYMIRQNRTVSKGDLLLALAWEDPVRTTARVRGRVDKLLTKEEVKCCWSRKAIRINSYAVDHAMPFARWPNNDLWNLLPAQSKINAEKSDKLPTSLRMMNSRHVITGWWEQAWQDQADEFFIQANLSLPNLSAANRSFSDVFEAMVMQRDRIKDFQQLKEWQCGAALSPIVGLLQPPEPCAKEGTMNAFKHLLLLTTLIFTTIAQAADSGNFEKLPPLKNFQVNTENMVSSGLPSKPHFDVFKAQGVTSVIDLIPGDRSEEREIVLNTGLAYENVQVVWDNPTLENFQEYVGYMQQAQSREGTTLTHCKLNWRGAVFTYLYRVTQLGEPEAEAKADLDAIWQPDETWQAFIDTVKAHYQVS